MMMKAKNKIAMIAAQVEQFAEESEVGIFLAPVDESDAQTSMLWWFPKLQEINDILLNLPKTRFVTEIDWRDLSKVFDGEKSNTLGGLSAEISKIVEWDFSWPMFLRTDYASHKHEWDKTCFVSESSDVANSILGLLEGTMMAFGLSLQCLAIREYIPMHTIFTAFYGNMPINREFRFFVSGGEVEFVQPYWPPHAIEGHIDEEKNPDWRKALLEISRLSRDEYTLLEELAILAGNAMGQEHPWSVDFSQDREGIWYLIDMARGEKSYRWEPDFTVVGA